MSRARGATQDYGSNLSFKKLNAASPLAEENRALVVEAKSTTVSFRVGFSSLPITQIPPMLHLFEQSHSENGNGCTKRCHPTSRVKNGWIAPVSATGLEPGFL